MTKGADIERKLDTLKREAARRGSDGTPGPSSAALATDLWWDIVRYCDELSVSAIQREFGEAIAAMTGIHAEARQRDLIARARNHKGMELLLFTPSSGGSDAVEELRQVSMEAEVQASLMADSQDAKMRNARDIGEIGAKFRDAIVIEAVQATGNIKRGSQLKAANKALVENELKPISYNTFLKILRAYGYAK